MFKKKQWCSPEYMKNTGLLLLRLGIGVIFIRRGWLKLSDIDGVVGLVSGVGFFAPLFWAWLLALVEFIGGIMILIGFHPRLAAEFLIIDMILALILVHTKLPFPAAELPIALLVGLCALVGAGAGNWVVSKKDYCGMPPSMSK